MKDTEGLLDFLRFPLAGTEGVFANFTSLTGAIHKGEGSAQFVYVPGTRKDRVLLVAHADTFWDGQTSREE